MDTSSPAFVTALVIVIVIDTVLLVLAVLKGRYGLLFFGFLIVFTLFGPYGIAALTLTFPAVGACRLAKPRSFWARRFYDDEKMSRAVERFA